MLGMVVLVLGRYLVLVYLDPWGQGEQGSAMRGAEFKLH